jgi:PPK2 family polyphosphate:nucleotide phosphotransferase
MKSMARRLQARGKKVRVADWDPGSTPGYSDRAEGEVRLAANLARIDELQFRLYAESKQSLLIVLQGMDTSGKDGVIRKVMSAFNPSGCDVWPFKVPTAEEASHDFLWRIHRAAPGAGEVAIFNRSHYEDVLVVRVHELVPKAVWSERYDVINAFEDLLLQRGTRVIKFFLHISPEEQRTRLLARLAEPQKHWKFQDSDLDERKHWDDYHKAYDVLLRRCSTPRAPWFVVPADHKWYRDVAISEVVADTLEDMNPRVPEVALDVRRLRARLSRG